MTNYFCNNKLRLHRGLCRICTRVARDVIFLRLGQHLVFRVSVQAGQHLTFVTAFV